MSRIALVTAAILLAGSSLARAATFVNFTGGTYTQNFNSLPYNSVSGTVSSVNTANAVTLSGTSYSLQSTVFDFANAIDTGGTGAASASGGLGLSATMSGWYGASYGTTPSTKFGATNGDQTTGGVLSFGPNSTGTYANSDTSNRALGLIATSSSGSTAFGAKITNNTASPISAINLAFTSEFWKQGTTAKTVSFGYALDNANTLTLATATSTGYNELGTITATTGTVGAIDGTAAANESLKSFTNQALGSSVNVGGSLWLVWKMDSNASSGQGFGIDNLTFSTPAPTPEPAALSVLAVGMIPLLCTRRRK